MTLCQSSEHVQKTLLTKLLGQFIELHNTEFFKRRGLKKHTDIRHLRFPQNMGGKTLLRRTQNLGKIPEKYL